MSGQAELLERVRARLAAQPGTPTPSRVADAVRAEGGVVGDLGVLDALEVVRRETIGAGPLDDLLRLPGVSDVLVNGPAEVYVDDGSGLRRVDVRFDDTEAIRRLAQRLSAAAGRRLDDASPYVDVRLRDGTRLHAVLAPVARTGTCLSLRVPARRVMSMDELVGAGTMTARTASLLTDIVSSGLAFLISGGTGTGKTTLLASLLSCVDPRQRIVLVEDSGELRPHHPHVVALEARQANVEGIGGIGLRELVRQALRMRPDRLVVGEVRGPEILDLLMALNTGHEGGCGTIHANSARDLPTRVEALGIAAGMRRDAVHAQLASAIQVVLHLRRGTDGRRRLASVSVIRPTADGLTACDDAATFASDGGATIGPAARLLESMLRERAS